MNRYAAFLLATVDITEKTKDKYPLGDVQDVQCIANRDRYNVLVLTKDSPQTEAALTRHRSFLRRDVNEQNPEFVTYVLAVPPEHVHTIKDCLSQPDYPHGS